ncbi:MAG: nucleotidyltransferase family protein [Gammaproteobacteria bacterium]|nr:nucleotidyltransferase family protein [Gammaproteobacteria bacterium]
MSTAVNPEMEEQLRVWAGRLLVAPRDATPNTERNPGILGVFLRRHGVDLCLHHVLSEHAPAASHTLPGPDTRHEIAVEMARTHEFCRVSRALRERFNEPPLVFKGQALAHTLYPQPWLRPRGDIDILVKRAAMPPLCRAMERLGYEKALGTDGDLVMTQTAMRRRSGGVEHVWDLHWKLSNRPALSGIISCQALRQTAVEVAVGNTIFAAPSDVDSLLIACLHLVGHHAGEVRLIWLYDIHLLVAALSGAERERFLDKAMDGPRVRAACHAAFELTQRYLPAERTDDLRRELDPGTGARQRSGRTYLSRLAEDARAVDKGHRLRFVRQHVFPSADYMMKRFNIRRRWQLPFWYAVRIGRAIPKLFRRR